MTEETTAIATVEGFELPDRMTAKATLEQLNQFQSLIRNQLVKDHDFGVIPNTRGKATLFKPGAEKIAKLLGLADTYEIIEQTVDWEKGLFQYVIRVSLVSIRTGQVIAQGVGECNSYESKYRYKQVFERELKGYGYESTSGLQSRTFRGGGTKYRIPNDDSADNVNTILKMAKKRAMIDAALSVGALSDLFTQDMDETPEEQPPAPPVRTEPPVPVSEPGEDISLGVVKDVEDLDPAIRIKALRDKVNEARGARGMTSGDVLALADKHYQAHLRDLREHELKGLLEILEKGDGNE